MEDSFEPTNEIDDGESNIRAEPDVSEREDMEQNVTKAIVKMDDSTFVLCSLNINDGAAFLTVTDKRTGAPLIRKAQVPSKLHADLDL